MEFNDEETKEMFISLSGVNHLLSIELCEARQKSIIIEKRLRELELGNFKLREKLEVKEKQPNKS